MRTSVPGVSWISGGVRVRPLPASSGALGNSFGSSSTGAAFAPGSRAPTVVSSNASAPWLPRGPIRASTAAATMYLIGLIAQAPQAAAKRLLPTQLLHRPRYTGRQAGFHIRLGTSGNSAAECAPKAMSLKQHKAPAFHGVLLRCLDRRQRITLAAVRHPVT